MKSSSHARFRTFLVVLAISAASLLLGRVSPVQAHAVLLRSDPPDNSVLEQAPAEVRLWFSGALLPDFSSARILDTAGSEITASFFHVTPGEESLVVIGLPPLEPGVYTIHYRVSSAIDGHETRGYIVFSAGGSAIAPGSIQGDTSQGTQSATPLEVGLRWLNYLALMVCTGSLGVLSFVFQNQAPAVGEQQAARRVIYLGAAASAAAVILGLIQFAWQVGSLAAGETGGAAVWLGALQLVSGTYLGLAWLWRELLLVGLALALLRLAKNGLPGRLSSAALLLAACGALLAQSLVSHAAIGRASLGPVMVNTLHLIFAGLWMGGLAAMLAAFGLRLPAKDPGTGDPTRRYWLSFSRLAAVSVGLLFASGVFSAGVQVISADALLLSAYGRALIAKLGLVLLAGLVGLANSAALHPWLATRLGRLLRKPAGWSPLTPAQVPLLVLAEIGLGVLVLLVVGLITSLPPARDRTYAFSPQDQADQVVLPVHDLMVTFSIKPNRPGLNIVNLRVINSRRPAPAEILRVIVRTTYLEQDLGTGSLDADFVSTDSWTSTYRLASSSLTQPGKWAIEVLVRRAGLPDSRVATQWIVLPLGELRPALLSRFAWQGILEITAGALAALVVLLAAWRLQAGRRV